jgi:NhaA family Na+:H+ antiporter
MARRGPISTLRGFLDSEAAGGILLIAAAALAMAVANSGWGSSYHAALHAPLGPLPLLDWINDGLMPLFFLLVGLEIKREFTGGHLASWTDRGLPLIAAAIGMAVPAAIYLIVAAGEPVLVRGWAIPAATDIAFALGVLALLGQRAPTSLKLLLTTIAIADDLGAVAIIALAYSKSLDLLALAAAAVILLLMLAINRFGVRRLWPYLLLAFGLWLAVLHSGVHATVAGVLAAFAIPGTKSPDEPDDERSPLHRLEQALQPWVAFAIVPLFGFANAGVTLAGLGPDETFGHLPLAIAAGLFLGKQIGIFAGIRLAVAVRIGDRPRGASWGQVYGMAILCGIGFTMSLFIGGIAYTDPLHMNAVKVGVLGGSLLSALAGYLLLRFAPRAR